MSRSSISDNLKSALVFTELMFFLNILGGSSLAQHVGLHELRLVVAGKAWILYEGSDCSQSLFEMRPCWGMSFALVSLLQSDTLRSYSTQEVTQGTEPGTSVPVQGRGCHAVPKLWEWEATTNCVSQCTTLRRSAKSNLINSFSPLLIGFVPIDHLPVVCQSETVFFK